jgi:hypothetical protein
MALSFDLDGRWPLWFHFVAPGILVSVVAISILAQLRELGSKSPLVETRARIIQLHCENHLSYAVRYEVGGRTLEGNGSTRACGSAPVGSVVSVWYSSGDPEYVFFVPPEVRRAALESDLFVLVFMLYPVLVAATFLKKLVRRAR